MHDDASDADCIGCVRNARGAVAEHGTAQSASLPGAIYREADVAALAVQVAGLRRDVESLTAKIDSVAGVQEEHATGLDGLAELRRQVERILARS